jgi:hypothetical protein
MSDLASREAEIAETRNRLSGTIDRIQDKLTVSGMIDEVLGNSAVPQFDRAYGNALAIVRRNPIPVLVVAAGIGWLLNRIGQRQAEKRLKLVEAQAVEVAAVNDGRARTYDPDRPTVYPTAGFGERTRTDGLDPTL